MEKKNTPLVKNEQMKNTPIFFTMAKGKEGVSATRLLVHSLSTFGGKFGNAPFWIFYPPEEKYFQEVIWANNVEGIPLEFDTKQAPYFFIQKTAACAQAEILAKNKTNSLTWLNPMTLMLQEPSLFLLNEGIKAAFRPVHIQNIGSSSEELIDGYWQSIYHLLGRDKDSFTVRSLVDQKELRPYFNSHLFSIDPALGLLQEWEQSFMRMIRDEDFQNKYCADIPHRIFLHQAVLSGLLETCIGIEAIRILPDGYSYPLHLHRQIPEEIQAERLDDLVCPVYEEEFVYPQSLSGLQVSAQLADWLQQR